MTDGINQRERQSSGLEIYKAVLFVSLNRNNLNLEKKYEMQFRVKEIFCKLRPVYAFVSN